MKNFFVLEECKEDTLVTPIKAKNKESARRKYKDFEGGVFIIMSEEEAYNFALQRVGG